MNLLVKIPTRERGFEWLEGYLKCDLVSTRILLTLDDDQPDPPQWVQDNPRIIWRKGPRRGKIEAINRDIPDFINGFDVLLVGSDDMWVQKAGYDRIICNDMKAHYPDTDGCLWYDTEDSIPHLEYRLRRKNIMPGSREFYEHWICMLPVMGRMYWGRFGYVYHSAYKSFWCDNEYTKVALSMGKIKYMHNRIIHHQHYTWGAAMRRDAVNAAAEADNQMHKDQETFKRRQSYGFPA